jgi:hypothetical protein
MLQHFKFKIYHKEVLTLYKRTNVIPYMAPSWKKKTIKLKSLETFQKRVLA